VIDDPAPNAFATGVSPGKAAVTFTTGLLAILNREELEGVTSHEMSHIKNHEGPSATLVGFH
jgi:heat shock protein HtpX